MKNPIILSIDTSADDTSVAVTQGRQVLSHVEFSQISLHEKWGGIFPTVAKRAHAERIGEVLRIAIKKAGKHENIKTKVHKNNITTKSKKDSKQENYFDQQMTMIDAIAVTQGPGLAPALQVGIDTAKKLSQKFQKPLIAVNHMEGHIYSCFAQNSKGNPKREITFPYIALLVSGGHTELVLFTDHLTYKIIGKTKDDAVGEALDKAARMLGFGYPGGPVIERLSLEANNIDRYKFPRPLLHSDDLQFSYSGLKTAFLYFLRNMTEDQQVKNVRLLASSFQEATFEPLIKKTERAMKEYNIKSVLVGGGVGVNQRLRKRMRAMVRKNSGTVIFPPYSYLNNDNASMIGVVAGYKYQKKMFIDSSDIDRIPRWSLDEITSKI